MKLGGAVKAKMPKKKGKKKGGKKKAQAAAEKEEMVKKTREFLKVYQASCTRMNSSAAAMVLQSTKSCLEDERPLTKVRSCGQGRATKVYAIRSLPLSGHVMMYRLACTGCGGQTKSQPWSGWPQEKTKNSAGY